MGSYYSGKIEVIGSGPKKAKEREEIYKLISQEQYLREGLGQWTGRWKNWWPDDLLKEISKKCERTYIRLQTVSDSLRYYDQIFYKGEALNGETPVLTRFAPISAVQRWARRVKKEREKRKAGL